MSAEDLIRILPGGIAGTVRATFECMYIVEEELTLSGLGKENKAVTKHTNLFPLLSPNEAFTTLDLRVFRWHVRELCQRFAGQLNDEQKEHRELALGMDRMVRRAAGLVALPTNAEVMLGLMEASLKSPLTTSAAKIYEQLFKRCQQLSFKPLDLEPAEQEVLNGYLVEIRGKVSRKLVTR